MKTATDIVVMGIVFATDQGLSRSGGRAVIVITNIMAYDSLTAARAVVA